MRIVNPGRARRWLWGLTAVAIIAVGVFSDAVAAHPGPLTGVRVAVSGTVLALSIALAARILIAFGPPWTTGRNPNRGRTDIDEGHRT